MKKNRLLSLLISFCALSAFAQESAASKSVADAFERTYNKDQYDSVFAMFSPEMKKALPLDKTREFLTGLKSQVGSITKKQFTSYQNSYAVYKTSFESATLALQLSIDDNKKIKGFYVKQFVDESQPKLERNVTRLKLPFKGEWTVFWGGDTKAQNYHVAYPAQKNAFDILITNGGKSFKTNGQANEDYYAFGQELIAPCDAEVVLAVDGIKDNKPGVLNPTYVPGNTVILKTDKNEFLFFAHFKQNSIVVKQGQKVKQGDLLGQCGNSGNSSEPHLHFHIQNIEDFNSAIGAKCFFEKIIVNGKVVTDYSPVKGEKIKNE